MFFKMQTSTNGLQALLIVLTLTISVVACSSSSGSGGAPAHRTPPTVQGAANGKKPTTTPTPVLLPTPMPTYSPVSYPTPFPVMTPAPLATDCYKSTPFVCKIERLLTEKTNRYRASVGKPPLTYDPKMAFVARDWSAKQARSGNISHSGFPNARSTVYRQEFNASRDFYAENVAMSGGSDSGSQSDAEAESIAEDFASMWWHSSGHRANMLGDYSNLGMGMADDGRGSWYGTQVFE